MPSKYQDLLTTQNVPQNDEIETTYSSPLAAPPQGLELTKKRKKKKAEPASGNIFGAMWQASSLTRNIETIKNMTPEDKEKLENAYAKFDEFQHSNVLKKAALSPALFAEQAIASIAHGNAWQEAQAFGAATAGGVALGWVGGLAGGAIGGAIGGAGGARAGYMAGKYVGHAVGGLFGYSRVSENKTVAKFRAAGYDIEKSSNWQSLVGVVKELPVAMLAGGAFGAYLKAAPFLKKAGARAGKYASPYVREYAGAAGRKAAEYARKAGTKVAESETLKKATEVAKTVGETAKGIIEPAKTYAAEMLDHAYKIAKPIVQEAQEKIKEATPYVKEMITDVAKNIQEDAEAAYKYAKPYIDEIVKKSGGAIEELAKKIGETGVVPKVVEKVAPVLKKGIELGKKAVEEARPVIEKGIQKGKEKARPLTFAAAMRVAESEWATTTAEFLVKTMSNAWAHAINAKNVIAKHKVSTAWAKKQWDIMNGKNVMTSRERAAAKKASVLAKKQAKRAEKTARLNEKRGITPEAKPETPDHRTRFNMNDILQEGTPWKIEQVEITEKKVVDGVEKEITRKVDMFVGTDAEGNEYKIMSTEDVAEHYREQQQKIMEQMTPEQKEQYMYGTAQNIDNIAGSLTHNATLDVMDGLLVDATEKKITVKEGKIILKSLIMDKKANDDFSAYYRGERDHLDEYHPLLRKLADNLKKANDKTRNHTRRLGVPQQDLKYPWMPQNADPHKIAAAKKETVIADLMSWMDHEYMGNETPEAQHNAAKAIAESFYSQDALTGTLNAGFKGAVTQLQRVIHFKDAASYNKFLRKYGIESSPIEAMLRNVKRTARAQAVITQFGPMPKENYLAMMEFMGAQQKTGGLISQLASTIRRKAITNIFNGLFGDSATNYIANDWLVPSAVRAFKMMDSIGRNIATGNNAIYDVLEVPYNMATLKSAYGINELSGFAITNGYKNMVSALKRLINGEIPPETRQAMIDVGIDFEAWNMLWPHSYGEGSAYDIPLKAREFNELISHIKGTDTLSRHNQMRTALQYQNMFGGAVKAGKSWESLTPSQRGLFQSSGINRKEYNVILKNPDIFLTEFGDLQGIYSTDFNANLEATKIDMLSYKAALESEDQAIRAIGLKLAAMQYDFVRQANVMGSSISRMAFLGKSATSNDFGSFALNNMFAFRGYIFDRLARSSAKFDLEGHSPDMNKYAKFAFQRMQVGIIINALRNAAQGKVPEMDGVEDWIKFMADASARGDLFPLSIMSELFEDTYNVQGNGFAGNLATLLKPAGPGMSYTLQKAYDAIDAAKAAADGDSAKVFKKMRRLTPGANWTPTTFIFNRILLDNIFTYLDEDGAYDLFKKEIKNQNKRNFKHAIAPGELTKIDSVGMSAMEQERNDLIRQAAKERKANKSGDYTELRNAQKQAKAEIKQIEKAMLKMTDNEEIKAAQHQIDVIQNEIEGRTAYFYTQHKTKGLSKKQARAALENAKKRQRELLAND